MNELLSSKPRVLVIDPEPIGRTLIEAVLQSDHHYDVTAACSGQLGLAAAHMTRPDLILLPASLPGEQSGYSVCRTLKNEPRTRRIPIIFLIANSSTQERAQGFEAGADDFVMKPFHRIELLTRVRSLLRIKALNDHLDEVEDVIYSLRRAVEVREGGAACAQDTDQVIAYTQALGSALGMSDEALRLLGQAALLRDVGKIGLPDMVLNKRGVLSDQEQKRMQRHAILGESIMAPLRSTAALLPMIRHHHERVDGKGYPDGLAGDQIPLGARIIAIADAFHAMLSTRPYRPALTLDKALQTLESGAGRQWDARLVTEFVAWVSQHPQFFSGT